MDCAIFSLHDQDFRAVSSSADQMKASVLGFIVSHPSAEVRYLLFVDRMGEHREKVVCGFLSRQLGKREQPNSSAADEMDEIEAAVQADLKTGGLKVGQGGGVPFKNPPEGRCIDLEMSPSKSAYPLSG